MADRLQNMYTACMPSITIRNVPDQVRDELAARAAATGRSLQEYLLARLADLARKPDVAFLVQTMRDRKRVTRSTLSPDRILAHRDADRE